MANMDLLAQQIASPDVDLRIKCVKASDLRDAVDQLCSGANYPVFLNKFIPIFTKILEGPPVHASASWQHRLRNSILEIIHRLPTSPAEHIKPYAGPLVELLLKLLRIENEDNAVLCMKAIMDLQRLNDEAVTSKVMPFLDIIEEMFASVGQIVKETIDNPSPQAGGSGQGTPSTIPNSQSLSSPRPASPAGPAGTTPATEAGPDNQNRQLAKGMRSFKVLAECPITVVSLFQSHKNIVPAAMKKFTPLVKEMLLVQAAAQRAAHEEAAKRGDIHYGVAKDIKNKQAFGDLVSAQVKTMSFLAYLLRLYEKQFQDFREALPEVVVRLLQDCPEDRSAARKELLVAFRHILNIQWCRVNFRSKLDDLLDDRTLLGDGLTVHETMRPLAYSMLADLIHHIRDLLSPAQVERAIEVFSKHMLDEFPGTSFQNMSAKLLLNMNESIAGMSDKIVARHFLVMIMRAIADKFAMMNREYQSAVKQSKKEIPSPVNVYKENHLVNPAEPPDWDETDIFFATPIKAPLPRDPDKTPVDDNKFVFKHLMGGLKNLFYRLKLTNPESLNVSQEIQPSNWNEASYGYSAEEVEIITRLFREGARVFRYFQIDPPVPDASYTSPVEYWANNYMLSSSKEEKDLLETFATVFHCIDPATFHEVFTREIPHLYELTFEHATLLHIPQFFLASEATSPSFSGMLLQFLMGKIEEVGTKDVQKSSILLRLFKLSFMAVTLFSNHNELVLLPHVKNLLVKSIQLSTKAEEPLNYFYLLRSLFRSIGGGRFEALYKEILPLLEMLLDVLNNLLLSARKPQERYLYVELCLTVPARLSNLLPYLSYLMRPLVVALRADSDLVGQGLRTLELCVDNLTADYLDPIMAPVIDDLMEALWDHLKPAPYSHFHSHSTLRILGKLGGRNRKFLTRPPQLDPKPYADDEASFDVKLIGATKGRAFPLTLGINLAVEKLEETPNPKKEVEKKNDSFYKQQAFRFICSQIKLHVGYDQLPSDLPQAVRLQANDMADFKLDSATDLMNRFDREKSVAKKQVQEQTLQKLLRAAIFSTTVKVVKDEAVKFLENVCQRFMLLELGRAMATEKHLRRDFTLKAGEGPVCLDSRVLADAILDLLSHENEAVRDAAIQTTKKCHDIALLIFGSSAGVQIFPFFNHLLKVSCHSCFEEAWYLKAGGHLALDFLTSEVDLGENFYKKRQLDIVRALMFLIKDIPQDLPIHTRVKATETLERVLRRCNNEKFDPEDLKKKNGELLTLLLYLLPDLSHQVKSVREAAKKAFAVIAETKGIETWQLIAPLKDRLLVPIFVKPLRALQFPVQCGFIDAVTYCLELKHDVVEYNSSFNRLLEETLALTDQEDDKLTAKPTEFCTAENILACRVASLRLMSLALTLTQINQPEQQNLWNRIISVFFKSLYSTSAEVSEAANAGLKSVLNQHSKLPKDLLQAGLRPILMTLQSPDKINLAALEGLHRLLQILTNYFKPEIGERLIGYMDSYNDNEKLLKYSFGLLEQNPIIKVVIATLDVFHLLPAAANNPLPKLVGKVMEFEQKLRRTLDSPLRPPLYRFLAKYPQQTWQFFAVKLHDLRFSRFFCQLIVHPICSPIANHTAQDVNNMMRVTLMSPQGAESAKIAGIDLITQIVRLKKDWLNEKAEVRQALLASGRHLYSLEKQHKLPTALRLPARRAGEQLVETLCTYMGNKPDDVDFLFNIINMITTGELQMQQQLRHYIYTKVICSDSIELQKSVVLRCLDCYQDDSMKPKTKTFLFHYLLNPIFASDIMRHWKQDEEMTGASTENEKQVIDADMMVSVHEKLWKVGAKPPSETSAGQVDHSRLEALQMSALLVKYQRPLISQVNEANPAMKLTTNISKFVWAHTQSDETITKFAAFVVFAFCVAQFASHHRLVMTVYNGLLKAHQTEGRSLVIQALDLMAPVLPERLPKQDREKIPQWARLPKRAIAEDSSNLQQLISVLQFFIRHAEMFYEYRDQYISSFLPALQKIAQPLSTSQDNRKLVLNVIEMIKNWEERKYINRGGRKRHADGSPKAGSPPRGPPSSAADDYRIPTSIRLNTIKHLEQLMTSCMERYPVPASEYMPQSKGSSPQSPPSTETVSKTFGLFYDLLSPGVWNDLDIDLFPRMTENVLSSERTDKILNTLQQEKIEDKTVTVVVNTLQLVRYTLNTKTDQWIQGQMPFIERILEKSLKSDHMEIQDCLHTASEEMDQHRKVRPLLQRIIEAIPEQKTGEDEMEVETPGTSFIKHLSTIAKEALESTNIVSGINILWTLSKCRPAMVDQHLPTLVKVMLHNLSKDHLHFQQMASQANQAQALRTSTSEPQYSPAAAESTVQLINRSIDTCASRMANLGEQRRPFLSVLANLVERSINVPLCEKVISMVETWIFDSEEPFPTLKEKTAVLHKMCNFEQRQDPALLHRFLDLVIRIYEDPKITRTELTVRLEHAFLIGTRAQDVTIRNRFMAIFDRSLTRTASARLGYVLGSQNWDPIADRFWISQATQLMLGAMDMSLVTFMHPEDIKMLQPSELFAAGSDPRKDGIMLDDGFEQMMAAHRRFNASLGDVRLRDLLEPLCQLQHVDDVVASRLWSALFPIFWTVLNREEMHMTEKALVTLLTKEHNQKQIDKRPNPVQALLDGAVHVKPRIKLPPHVLKFVARSYDAWYPALRYMEDSAIEPVMDTVSVRESTLDALTEMYSTLSEDDLYYGTWRRRCKFVETNAALSYEQNGMWDKAMTLYEQAQVKARTGTVPFSQAEYMLWEDHWVICAQKLQQWDILSDFAKHENFNDLLLEASFRNLELWQQSDNLEQINHVIKGVSDSLTPRRAFFQAFMALLKFNERDRSESAPDFGRACDEAMQLSIRKWHQLPKRITNAHIPILEGFQQLVELHDAQTICTSLHQTRADNLDQKSQELKLLLGSWRDRLPNVWDDINAWQDLVTWRQHIFALINKTYLNLVPQTQGSNTNSSFAYRGYHETAWIINRFAHVARKHRMPDVCINQLSKIYTLPNIEIQEAFLKLREQAKCHYQSQNELNSGLDVISNTNMNYFAPPQKAEFFTLKGMFLAKLGQREEANEAFGTALYYDIRLPKAWAEWGHYNDTAFKDEPDNFSHGAHALSCYLEAASLWKSARSRKLLNRVLWLISIDNPEGQIAAAFMEFKGDQPLWYWVTFIPQLLTSLSHREAAICRIILVRIAKIYPQALFFLLRTHKEDVFAIKKSSEEREKVKARQAAQQQQQQQSSPKQPKTETSGDPKPGVQPGSRPATANGEKAEGQGGASGSPKKEGESQGQEQQAQSSGQTSGQNAAQNNAQGARPSTGQSNGQANGQATGQAGAAKKEEDKPGGRKQAWEYCDEITQVLKTAFPLLALTMETIAEQVNKHFKCPPDEDAYRLIVALLNDGLSYVNRSATIYQKDSKLPAPTEANIKRFAETILPNHIKGAFDADFVENKPTMFQYIQRLRKWRDKFEEKLDRRQQHKNLEELSNTLSEFRYNRLDEVEVPGQYVLHKDKNQDFVRIERFLPDVDLIRNVGLSHRRLKIRGSDGAVHAFAVHHPAARNIRREERVAQLFRVFNSALSKRKEARRRNLQFYLPAMVPLAPTLRLVQENSQYISLQGVYEDYCRRNELDKDEPILFNMEKMRSFVEHMRSQPKGTESLQQLRLECFRAIQDRFVPKDIALEYFQSIYPSFGDFWLFRRQFSYSFAAFTFMSYVMFMTNRTPSKLSISRETGNVWGTELMATMNGKAIFHSSEAVPFRLTPNLQMLLGPIATEGIFGASIMAIARSLTEPEFALDQHLSVFVRDELYTFLLQQRKEAPDNQIREAVQNGSDVIIKRALAFASPPESADLPAHQTVIDKISDAVNPARLASMDALFMPYL